MLLLLFGGEKQNQKSGEENTTQVTNSQVQEKQKTQEEIEAENALKEERLNSLATQYCVERKQNSRYYPLPEAKTTADGKIEYEQKNLKKKGSALTQSDCRTVIDYFTWFSNEYGQVASINIQNVIERKYWIGMNVAELMSSMGWPNDINTTNYGSGKTEQWIYNKDSYGASAYYFYVENSKVTSYQDF